MLAVLAVLGGVVLSTTPDCADQCQTLTAAPVQQAAPRPSPIVPAALAIMPPAGATDVTLTLSDGTAVAVDQVLFASGYRADLARVPYLSGVLDQVSVTDGFPDLSEGFETSLNGLYITGFASTRDFGPFYGFTAGCASAARIAVAEMLR